MKVRFFTFLMAMCLVGFSSQAVVWPTKVVKVDPDPGTTIGALQAAIAANGSAIYELKRGGIYLTNGQYTIPSTTGTLIIRAEDGTGPRPVIMGGVPSSGYPSDNNVIRINGDIKFENIYLTGEDMNAVVHKNTLRVQTGTWFEFNGCMFDKDNAASIRNGVGNCVYIFNNCTFRNQVDYTSLSNGRAWDAREAFKNITLIIKNCTFYNISSRIIRPSTSDFDSIVFVNNTCYNVHEALPFGIARKVTCNNNIFYNVGLGGTSSQFGGFLEIDSIGGTANADAARKFDFRNNLFYTDPSYIALMTSTTLFKRSILNRAAKVFLASGQLTISDTIKNQSIAFTNPPPMITGYVKYMWENGSPSGFTTTPTADQKIDAVEDPLNYGDVLPPKVQFNFGYPTTHMAYTAGLKSDILGDKKWFGKATGVVNFILPEELEVKAFFNTGTQTLNFIFNTPEVASFSLRMYSLDGRQHVNRMVYNYGQTTSQVHLQKLTGGIYIYEIESTALNGSKNHARGKVVL
jgi:hypothetical protein